MNFDKIKKYKNNEQQEYEKRIDQKRDIPDYSILPKPDEQIIPPIDIREYK